MGVVKGYADSLKSGSPPSSGSEDVTITSITGNKIALDVAVKETTTTTLPNATIPALGSLAFGSISGTYATVLVMGGDVKLLHLLNGTDVDLVFSLDNGTTNHIFLPRRSGTVWDFAANEMVLPSDTIQVKDNGTAAASGAAVAMVAR